MLFKTPIVKIARLNISCLKGEMERDPLSKASVILNTQV